MKESTKPISEVRQKLPALAKAADERMARVVITQQGRPQAVLLGYEDYLGMKTAVELLSRPGLVEGMETASAELERGEGVPLEGLKEAVRGEADGIGYIQYSGDGWGESVGSYVDPDTGIPMSKFKPINLTLFELKAKALLNKGNALTRLGKADEAIASYDEVLDLLSTPTLESEGLKKP
ncbi:MAG: type II toxin-antitoxin system prevent-host-death family antitoxin [Acidobacteriota bacterium]